MTRFHYWFRRICGLIIGVTFFIAGVLKLMDPVGAGLVVGEYYRFLHIGFLGFSFGFVGVALALLESFLGIALITGVWRKITAFISAVMIAFFTLLTLVLLIANPDMDCGCFGRAVKLTHAQSFIKNIVLCLLGLAAFFPFRDFGHPKKKKYVSFALVAVAVVIGTVYSLVYIPLIDFTAFAPGTELQASLDNPSESEDDYMATYIYEKNGNKGSFTIDRLPDSTWTFVAVDTVLRNGPKVDESVPMLSFTDAKGDYQDEMAAQGKVIVVSVYKVGRVSVRKWNRIGALLEAATHEGARPILLVSSSLKDLEGFLPEKGLDLKARQIILGSAYSADYKTLISLNRANGGATYFDDGELIRKWAYNFLPSSQKLSGLFSSDPTEEMLNSSSDKRLQFQAFLLYVFALMLLL